MDRSMMDELRTRLEEERQREQERLDELDVVEDGKSVHNVARNEAGMAPAAQVTRDRSERLGQLDHTRSRLQKIDEALERMDDGSYGECESCSEAIADDRLVVMPLATRCIDCAEDAQEDGSEDAA